MPTCSVLTCKNDSKRNNLTHGGISYHRFPSDPDIKLKWIDATGRQDWMPTKFSTICSAHFLEENYMISKKGLSFLKDNSVPVRSILIFQDRNKKEDCDPLSILDSDIKKEPEANTKFTYSSPREKELQMRLNCTELKIRRQILKIKRLQSQNRRLKEKLKNIEEEKKSLLLCQVETSLG